MDPKALAAYDAAAAAGAHKKASKQQAREDFAAARRAAAAAAPSDEEVEGTRKADASILKNRGLMKYRNKDRKYVHAGSG